MSAELEQLKRLQWLDVDILALRKKIAAQPARSADIDARLNGARQRVADAKKALADNDKARRAGDQEIQTLNVAIGKYRDQSSAVKTNEQYKALLGEIDGSEKKIAAIEDQILELMMTQEEQQKSLQLAESALAEGEKLCAEDKSLLDAEIAETDARLKIKLEERKKLTDAIDENLLAHYNRVLQKRGSAIAAAREMRCQGCLVSLRQQVYAQLQRDEEIVYCDSCARILYYDGDEATDTAADTAGANITEREWVHQPGHGPNGAFLVFITKGQATWLRAFDAVTGVLLEQRTTKGEHFRHAYAPLLESGRNIFVSDPSAGDKTRELPVEVLDELREQLPTPSES